MIYVEGEDPSDSMNLAIAYNLALNISVAVENAAKKIVGDESVTFANYESFAFSEE